MSTCVIFVLNTQDIVPSYTQTPPRGDDTLYQRRHTLSIFYVCDWIRNELIRCGNNDGNLLRKSSTVTNYVGVHPEVFVLLFPTKESWVADTYCVEFNIIMKPDING